jgi:hypothetical protein
MSFSDPLPYLDSSIFEKDPNEDLDSYYQEINPDSLEEINPDSLEDPKYNLFNELNIFNLVFDVEHRSNTNTEIRSFKEYVNNYILKNIVIEIRFDYEKKFHFIDYPTCEVYNVPTFDKKIELINNITDIKIQYITRLLSEIEDTNIVHTLTTLKSYLQIKLEIEVNLLFENVDFNVDGDRFSDILSEMNNDEPFDYERGDY